MDPDSVPLGATVTVWGIEHNHPRDPPRTDALDAIAQLPGEARNPAATTGSAGGVFLTGRRASLDPVTLALPYGKYRPVVVPGAALMLVLTRRPAGGFARG